MTSAAHARHGRLDQPVYGCTFGEGAKRVLRKTFWVRGRASQSEFWWGYLTIVIVQTVLVIGWVVVLVAVIFGTGLVAATSPTDPTAGLLGSLGIMLVYLSLYVVLILSAIPLFTLTARRLHDAGLSGWLTLLNLVAGGFMVACGFMHASTAGLRFEVGTVDPVIAPQGVAPYGQPAAPMGDAYGPAAYGSGPYGAAPDARQADADAWRMRDGQRARTAGPGHAPPGVTPR